MRQKEQGDDEAQGIDETFIDAYVACRFLSNTNTDRDYTLPLEWSMDSPQRADGVSGSTASSCSSQIPQVRILCCLGMHAKWTLMLLYVVDIKEVLLFPAMKPELAASAGASTVRDNGASSSN